MMIRILFFVLTSSTLRKLQYRAKEKSVARYGYLYIQFDWQCSYALEWNEHDNINI